MRVMGVNDGVAAATLDQPTVYGKRCYAGDKQGEDKVRPEGRSVRPASIAPGMTKMMASSTISMTVIKAVSDAKARPAAAFSEITRRGRLPFAAATICYRCYPLKSGICSCLWFGSNSCDTYSLAARLAEGRHLEAS